MRQVEFLLALPEGTTPDHTIMRVPDPGRMPSGIPALWTSPQTAVIDGGMSGILIGHAFSRSGFRPAEAREIFGWNADDTEAGARRLIGHIWGAYLLVSCDQRSGVWAVMPDPSGLLPVYRSEQDRIILFASDPALFEHFTLRPMKVSYRELTGHLRRPELRQRQTCLEDVEELVPGTLLTLSQGQKPRPLWHAPDFARNTSPLSFREHAEELRYICTGVVGCWGGLSGGMAIATSGGVDSSLICAAAATAGIKFGCVSLATIDPSGDERIYARSVAEACGAPFTERLYDPDLFDPARAASSGLPRPGRRAFLSVLDDAFRDAMAELGAEVTHDGNGGDNIFCFLHSAAPLADRLRAEGMGGGIGETFLAMCQITGCSASTMLGATLRRLTARTKDVWPADQSLLHTEPDFCMVNPLTPWLPEDGQRRDGWQDHLQLIMHSQNQIHGAGTALPRFSPLASQPIVEFCLSVPTWHWTVGGRNRALARAAFADILPHDVLARTSKAGPDSLTRTAFSRNKTSIAERLLEGHLAAAGVIDRAAVVEAMGSDPFSRTAPVRRLLDLLEAENWIRSWTR